jgi:hypothetical protein
MPKKNWTLGEHQIPPTNENVEKSAYSSDIPFVRFWRYFWASFIIQQCLSQFQVYICIFFNHIKTKRDREIMFKLPLGFAATSELHWKCSRTFRFCFFWQNISSNSAITKESTRWLFVLPSKRWSSWFRYWLFLFTYSFTNSTKDNYSQQSCCKIRLHWC